MQVPETLLGTAIARARLGRAARERISHEFPLDKMETGYVRLIESLVR